MIKLKTALFTHDTLRRFTPLQTLNAESMNKALQRGEVISAKKGKKLTTCHINDPVAYFLLQGTIEAKIGNFKKLHINSEQEQARSALNSHFPKGCNIRATSDDAALLLIRHKDLQQAQVTPPPTPTAETSSVTNTEASAKRISYDNDWMSTLLTSPLFKNIAPSQLAQLFGWFEEVEYKQGEIIIRKGQYDNFFYVIKSGSAFVTTNHNETDNSNHLRAGSFFGGGALIGETVHSATIEMQEDGIICRLKAEQFHNLFKDKLLTFISEDAIPASLKQQPSLMYLDVRYPLEYQEQHRNEAVNIPISQLRESLPDLVKDGQIYLIDYGHDKRSQLAALLLIEHGYKAQLITT